MLVLFVLLTMTLFFLIAVETRVDAVMDLFTKV